MIQPTVELISPSDALILDALDGWGILNIDLGDPEVRTQAQNAPDADGSLDFTNFVGARTMTIGMELVEFSQDMFTMVTRLKGFCRPRVPLKIVLKLSDSAPWLQADIRRGPWTNPLNDLWVQNPVLQWVVPKGVFESLDAQVIILNPSGTGVELGRTYDRVGDRVYPTSPVLGSGSVVNNGNVEAYPLIRIYGPCTDPAVWNDSQNKVLSFAGITILAGEFLEVETRYHTVRYQGLITDDRYSTLNFTTSRWWTLNPRSNQLRFVPATAGVGSNAEVTYRHTYDL